MKHFDPATIFSVATQNPIEQEGTYPLPEAQLDRFMLKIQIDYPTKEEERKILDRMAATQTAFDIQKVITPEEILDVRSVIDQIYIDDKIKDYIVDVVCATREPEQYGLELKDYINFGASPRPPSFGISVQSDGVYQWPGVCYPAGCQIHRNGCLTPSGADQL